MSDETDASGRLSTFDLQRAEVGLTLEEIALLRGVDVFHGLSDEHWSHLESALERVWVPAQAEVMQVGTPADGLYVVLSGRCQVKTIEGGRARVVAEIRAGQVLGEMSLLASSIRTVSVTALRDTVFAKLPADWFMAHALEVPPLLMRLGRIAARRAMDPGGAPLALRATANVFALRALGPDVDLGEVARAFRDALSSLGAVGLVDAAWNRDAARGTGPMTHQLNELEDSSDFVVYVDDGDAPWSARCARQADRILLVGVGSGPVAPPPRVIEDAATHHLLLLQPDEAREASGTAAWLAAHSVDSHHHVRLGVGNDMQRVARLLTGYGVGVAFSGAAARGAAHVGVLHAFEELGIPIDMVTGNSSGASIAASVSQGASAAQTLERYRYCLDAIGPRWMDLGPPFVSLMSGRSTASALQEVFGDKRIEDQFIPVSMSATDLSRGQRVAIDKGPLWLGVRASASLPVYWPPVCQDGQVLVDGGVLANLPIEALEPYCGSGLMFASDLDISGSETFRAFRDVEPYGHTLSGWRVAFSRKGRYPRLNEIITHAMCLSSYAHREIVIALEGRPNVVFVRPRIEVTGFFGLSSREAAALVTVARADALEQVRPAWNLHRDRLGTPARPVTSDTTSNQVGPFVQKTKKRLWARVLLVLVLLLVAFIAWANVRTRQLQARERPIPESNIPVPFPSSESERGELEPGQDPAQVAHERAVARGRHIVRARLGCVDCHGEDLSGGPVMDVPLMGSAFAPNITRGGLTQHYSTEDWQRIIRHGVRPDGLAALMPVMESALISDQEVSDIIAYAQSLPASDVVRPSSQVGVLGAVLFAVGAMEFSADEVDHGAVRLERPPSIDDPVAYGEHLAHTCRPCHGPDLGGGPIPGGDPSWPLAANLTPHADGLQAWTQDDFVRLLREGKRPDGSDVNPIMPWRVSRNMADAEIHALYQYLQGVPAVPGP